MSIGSLCLCFRGFSAAPERDQIVKRSRARVWECVTFPVSKGGKGTLEELVILNGVAHKARLCYYRLRALGLAFDHPEHLE